MKKVIFSCLLAASTIVALNAQAQSGIPINAKKALAKAYPTAKAVKWDKENGNFEASFNQNTTKMSLLIDKAGKILETETSIKPNDLPAAAQSYIKTKFGNVKLNDAASIVKADGSKVFEAEVKGVDYLFDSNGKFVKTAKD